jgi:hypothetical protein
VPVFRAALAVGQRAVKALEESLSLPLQLVSPAEMPPGAGFILTRRKQSSDRVRRALTVS